MTTEHRLKMDIMGDIVDAGKDIMENPDKIGDYIQDPSKIAEDLLNKIGQDSKVFNYIKTFVENTPKIAGKAKDNLGIIYVSLACTAFSSFFSFFFFLSVGQSC